jgi:hypothetical protein
MVRKKTREIFRALIRITAEAKSAVKKAVVEIVVYRL